MAKSKSNRSASQQLRIIGGQWRGRKLSFAPEDGLRPTLDRFRETLFNWLMFEVEGARCLDLFAGSGALGLEALSRGATSVTFVDQSQQATRQISSHLQTLGCDRGEVICSNAHSFLTQSPAPFDLVFLDPPFHKDLLNQVLTLLLSNGYIKPYGYIYIEAESQYHLPPLPEGWEISREKQVKNKVFFLLKNTPKS